MSEAVQRFVKDGSIIAAGGFPMARQSNAFCKEMLRQKKAGNIKVNDLHWIEPGIGYGADLLLAEGIMEGIITTISSHERPGLSNVARNSLEKGVPRKVNWEDESNLSLNLRIMAGALRIPFIPSYSGIWGDLRKDGMMLEDPYNPGDEVALLQALVPDISVVHVPFSDERGNGFILGSVYYDFWTGRAGRDVILIVDRIVDTEMSRNYPNLAIIPGATVSAVVPWYMGAWPTNSPGLYGEDLEHAAEFCKLSKNTSNLKEYIDKYVYSYSDHGEYLKLIDNKKKMEDNLANKLSEPFRKWIID